MLHRLKKNDVSDIENPIKKPVKTAQNINLLIIFLSSLFKDEKSNHNPLCVTLPLLLLKLL